MYTSLHWEIFLLCFNCGLILPIIALNPELYRLMETIESIHSSQEVDMEDIEEDLLGYLMGDRVSAHWPLQTGYPGQAIKNLNEHVSLFSHCLVNIQNYQGIEIIGIKSPVYLTRFDVANFKPCKNTSEWFSDIDTHVFLYGKIPLKLGKNCTNFYDEFIKYSDKSTKSRWNCRAQFDLFFPEPLDAPHIVTHSQKNGRKNLFDVSIEYTTSLMDGREAWSKIL